MQLVFIAHRGGAAFKITDGRAFVGDDECALKLAGVFGVDAEIGAQLHRAFHAFGDVAEAAVGEDGAVQSGEEIVGIGNDGAEVLADQFRVFAHGVGEAAEDDSLFGELGAEGGGDGDAVKDGIDGDAGEHFLFVQRNAELGVSLEQFGIDFVEAVQLLLRRGVIAGRLIVDWIVVQVRPVRLAHGEPMAVGFKPPLEQPIRFILFMGDEADGLFTKSRRRGIGFDGGDEPPLVLAVCEFLDLVGFRRHRSLSHGIEVHTEKLCPQPQVLVALGFLKTKPRPMTSSLKSISTPSR